MTPALQRIAAAVEFVRRATEALQRPPVGVNGLGDAAILLMRSRVSDGDSPNRVR